MLMSRDYRFIISKIEMSNVSLKLQGHTASGVLQFDLVSNRAGSKFFVKPRKVEKDASWKDAIASVVLQVFSGVLRVPNHLNLTGVSS